MSEVPLNVRSLSWSGSQKDLAQAVSQEAKAAAQQAAQESVQPLVQAQAQTKESPQEREQVEMVVAKLQDHLQRVDRSLDFQLDDSTGRTVIKVYDNSSDTLIRQIPSEEALELAKRLGDSEPLGLFTAQV